MSHTTLLLRIATTLASSAISVRWHGTLVFGANPITIQQFFTSLYGKLTGIAVAVSTFFFGWAALLYGTSGTGNERAKQHAQAALYAALLGLALALLAGVVAGLIGDAAVGK